jgi:hypothetical protein
VTDSWRFGDWLGDRDSNPDKRGTNASGLIAAVPFLVLNLEPNREVLQEERI